MQGLAVTQIGAGLGLIAFGLKVCNVLTAIVLTKYEMAPAVVTQVCLLGAAAFFVAGAWIMARTAESQPRDSRAWSWLAGRAAALAVLVMAIVNLLEPQFRPWLESRDPESSEVPMLLSWLLIWCATRASLGFQMLATAQATKGLSVLAQDTRVIWKLNVYSLVLPLLASIGACVSDVGVVAAFGLYWHMLTMARRRIRASAPNDDADSLHAG